MSRKQEYEALSAVVSRIESYDAIDCSNDEAEKFLKEYLYLDLMQTMPGCSRQKIRHLYLEDTLKLKDSTNKQDVHCFLFTDVFLVCKPLNKKSSDSRMKVIRQPFITDRLVVHELKESSGFLLIYLNEFNVACTYMLLFTSETRNWVEQIRKAQEDYRSLKFSSNEPENCVTYQNSYDDDVIYGNDHHQLFATSPRSSSRSSLIHSHSGSQDMGDQPPIQIISQTMAPNHQITCNQLSIQQQSPRAISFELGDLRNPSLVVEDTDAFARSQSFDNRSPVVTITSPRHERRAFLLRSQQQQPQQPQQSLQQQGTNSNSGCVNQTSVDTTGSSNYLNQNSLSLNVPYVQPVNSVSVQSRQTRRSVPNISNMNQNTITLNEPISTCQSNQINNPSTATIQVAVHPPPPSPSPPPPPSPPKRSPTKTITNRPLPPLPSQFP
ncbi:Rho guanine exchange factor-like protein, partial [Euroglyphus maynei]